MSSAPGSLFLSTLRLTLLMVALLGGPSMQGAEPEDWQMIKKSDFSFSLPKTFKQIEVQGYEGMLKQFVADGVKLRFDYAPRVDDMEHWPKGTTYEAVKLGDVPARIAVLNKVDPKVNSTSSTGIHVKRDGLALGMYAECQTEKDLALAKKIFLTIRFAAPEAKPAK